MKAALGQRWQRWRGGAVAAFVVWLKRGKEGRVLCAQGGVAGGVRIGSGEMNDGRLTVTTSEACF